MKIPKRVNAALDWMGRNVRIVAAVGAALIISIVLWWSVPLLSTFVLGLAIGGTIVHQRMASRLAALRSDNDDLLRQNGALRREKLTLASGVIAKQTQLTAKLPVIPDEAAGDAADQPDGSADPARTDPAPRGGAEPQAVPAARTSLDAQVKSAAAAGSAVGAEPAGRAADPEEPVNPTTRTRPDPAVAADPTGRTARLPAIPDEPDA